MQRRQIYVGTVMSIAALGLAACGSSNGGSAGSNTSSNTSASSKVTTINVGVPLSLTGPGGFAGAAMKDGLELGFKEANQQLASKKIALNPIYVDTKTDGPTGVALTQKLIEQNQVGVIDGYTASNVCEAALPVAQAREVPTIDEDCVTPGLTKFGNEIYSTVPNYAPLVARTIDEIVGPLNIHKAAFLENLSNPAFAAELGPAKAAFQAKGVAVTDVETVASGATTDFTAQLTKIAATHPDAVVLFVLGGQLPSAMSEARQLGLKNTVLIGEFSANTATVPKVAGAAAIGTYFPAHWLSVANFSRNTDYVQAFTAAYGHVPDAFATNGFIGVEALAAAVEGINPSDLASASSQRKAISKALANLSSFPCVAGTGTCNMPQSDRTMTVPKVAVAHYVKQGSGVGIAIYGYISGS